LKKLFIKVYYFIACGCVPTEEE